MSENTTTAAADARDLLKRARRIINAAEVENRDLSDFEAGRLDELLDIVSSLMPRRSLRKIESWRYSEHAT
jgi:hypothetical protein